MRLIDADALDVERICCYYGDSCRTDDVQEWLDEAPTLDVEPVRHGCWEEYPDKAHLRCTACKVEFLRKRMPETRNRCPNCGAKMDAKED